MSSSRPQSPISNLISSLIIGVGSFVAYDYCGPVLTSSGINWASGFAIVLGVHSGFVVLSSTFSLLAGGCEHLAAQTPRNHKGEAAWATWPSLKGDILGPYGWAPYWGTFARGFWHRGKAIFSDYFSNAVTIGTAGSGKGVGVVLPTCMAIRDSKLLPDFKGSNSCILKKPLEARGERFVMINIGGMHLEQLGEGDSYNPIDIILDDFNTHGCLQDVTTDSEEIALQLYPEPAQDSGDGAYWRGGSRDFISFALQQTVLVLGELATLGEVNLLLADKERLLKEAQWAAGILLDQNDNPLPPMPIEACDFVELHSTELVENYIKNFRAMAKGIVDILGQDGNKSSEAGSFLRGARQALSPFNVTTRAHQVLSKSTFRFKELKESKKPVTATIIIDSTRLAVQSKIASLLQWSALTELKRSQGKRCVYLICDETSNFKIDQLPSLLTYGREYKIKLHLFLQSISAFRTTYGPEALNTLLSETEIKQFLPGTREPETLALIEKLLGEESVMVKNQSGQTQSVGIDNFSYHEEAKPLMRQEQIRRTNKAILFIRRNRPVLATMVPISAIFPWKHHQGINPYFTKPFIQRTKLRLGSRKAPLILRPLFWLFGWRAG